jgi:two-component system, OmpR family, phosphate regulon response regulator PhoB
VRPATGALDPKAPIPPRFWRFLLRTAPYRPTQITSAGANHVRGRGAYVALLEDDMAIADMYGFGLQTAGYHVAAFPDPASFLRSLDVGLPDMVVLDWNLPIMNGGQVLKTLREDPRTNSLPVIVLSALSGRTGGELEMARDYGVAEWLLKSTTTPSALAATIARTVPPNRAAD